MSAFTTFHNHNKTALLKAAKALKSAVPSGMIAALFLRSCERAVLYAHPSILFYSSHLVYIVLKCFYNRKEYLNKLIA